MTRTSPVSGEVATELRRVVQRWQQLPLDHALAAAPLLRELIDQLARQAPAAPAPVVPDLGPAVLPDQLMVLVYDVCAADPDRAAALAPRLADLRRALH